jgi:hypothetical protein
MDSNSEHPVLEKAFGIKSHTPGKRGVSKRSARNKRHRKKKTKIPEDAVEEDKHDTTGSDDEEEDSEQSDPMTRYTEEEEANEIDYLSEFKRILEREKKAMNVEADVVNKIKTHHEIVERLKRRYPAFANFFVEGAAFYDVIYLIGYTLIMVAHCALYFFFADLRTEVEGLHWADALLVVGLVIAFYYNGRQESLVKIFKSRPDNIRSLFDNLTLITDKVHCKSQTRAVARRKSFQVRNKLLLVQAGLYKCIHQVLSTFTTGRKEERRCNTKAMLEVRAEIKKLGIICDDIHTITEYNASVDVNDIKISIWELLEEWIKSAATATDYLVLDIAEGHTSFFVTLFLFVFMPTQFFSSLKWYSIAIYGPAMMIFRSNDIIHRFYGNPLSYENHKKATTSGFASLERLAKQDVIENTLNMFYTSYNGEEWQQYRDRKIDQYVRVWEAKNPISPIPPDKRSAEIEKKIV